MASPPKLNLYKFVAVPTGKKASGASMVKAFNNLGSTLNSSVVITKQLYEAVLKQTHLRIKQQQKDERAAGRARDAASEAKQEGTGRSGAASAVKNFFSSETPNFFRGIANLATFFLRAFVIKNVLDWLGNPANREKLVKMIEGIGKFLKVLWEWAKFGVFNTLDGLAKMFGDGNWIQKLVGFGQFIAGLATLFLGVRWLKNPLNIVKDFKFVLTTLWKGLTGAKARLLARAGLGAVRAVATNPYVLGAAAVGGAAYLANKVTGQEEGAKVQTENAARVQQGKALPVQGVGGVGDVTAKPMLEAAAEGGIKQQGSAMKPLSSLPSMMKGKGAASAKAPQGAPGGAGTKMINMVSRAMMLPFKVIGAGLLAAMAGSMAAMGPFGKLLGPLVSSLMGPIAGYFGLPEALVKTIASKGKKFSFGEGFGAGFDKLFGKSRGKQNGKGTGKEYKPSGDTTVLGLLSDILGALMFINGKQGGGSTPTPPSPPGPPPADNKNRGMKAGTAKLPSTVKAGDDKVQALEGTIGDLKSKGYNYVPGTNNQFFTDKEGRAYRSQKSGNTGVGGTGLFGQDKFTLSSASQEEIDTYQRLVDKKEKPSRAIGGWINGPMTGYPVSLDGGNSVSFIGHGKEWVGGFAKGGNTGNAFVIPYNTPATRKDPSLTSKRYAQAASMGAALPDQSRIQDKNGRRVKSTAPGRAAGGIVSAAQKAIAEGKQGPASPPCASWVRMVLGMAGHPAANKVTQKSDLDPQKQSWGPNMAASFAGSDMGAVIKSQGALEPGDIILHKNTFGNYPEGAITHVSIAAGDGQLYHQSTSGGAPKKGGIWNFAAGIRLDGSGTIGGDGGSEDEAMSLEAALDMIRKGQSAVFDTYGIKAPAAPTAPAADATNARDKARQIARDKQRAATAEKPKVVPAVPASSQNAQAAASGAATPPPPVNNYWTDPQLLNPTFSLFGNYQWGGN